MSSPRLAGAATAVLLLLTTGCASSDGEETNASIGVNARSTTMGAYGMAVVTNGDGAATVVGSLVGRGDNTDRLVGARAYAESGPVRAILPRGAVFVPADGGVKLSPRKGILLASEDLREGFIIELTLQFVKSPDINLEVPVEPQTGPYADIEVLQPADGDVAPPDEARR